VTIYLHELSENIDSTLRIAALQHVLYSNKQTIKPDSVLRTQAEHRSNPVTSWCRSHV